MKNDTNSKQRQEAKEEAVLLALKNDMALIRRDLEIYGMKKDGSSVFISKSQSYNELWEDALAVLKEKIYTEKEEQTIHVSQKVILFDEEGKILTIRRTETAPSRPLHWDLPGGEVEVGEALEADIVREIMEETGLEVGELKVVDAVSAFNDRKEFWVTICYTAQPKSKEIVLSYEHDDYKWVTPDEFLKLKISPRLQKFVERFKYL